MEKNKIDKQAGNQQIFENEDKQKVDQIEIEGDSLICYYKNKKVDAMSIEDVAWYYIETSPCYERGN